MMLRAVSLPPHRAGRTNPPAQLKWVVGVAWVGRPARLGDRYLNRDRYGLTHQRPLIDRSRTSRNSSGVSTTGFPFMLLVFAASPTNSGTSCSLIP